MPTATATKEKKVAKAPSKKASVPVTPMSDMGKGSFAIIETGGKRYRVAVGNSIKIEKVLGEYKVGDSIVFDKVLLLNDQLGTPYIAGAKVTSTISEIARYPKVTVIKYKQKSRYFKKNGHRQPYFKVRIEEIG